MSRRDLLPLLGLLLAGCGGPQLTIRELSYPVFEQVVGAETRYERADPAQVQGLDAFPDQAEGDGDHRMHVNYWPGGDEERVVVVVTAKAKGSLPLGRLAGAVYPVSHAEAQTFARTGALPDPGAKPLCFSGQSELDEAGQRELRLELTRADVPPGTPFLAVPVLAEFKDGWIHVAFYRTMVPQPMKFLSEEELEDLKRRTQATHASPSATEPPAPAAEGEPGAKNP